MYYFVLVCFCCMFGCSYRCLQFLSRMLSNFSRLCFFSEIVMEVVTNVFFQLSGCFHDKLILFFSSSWKMCRLVGSPVWLQQHLVFSETYSSSYLYSNEPLTSLYSVNGLLLNSSFFFLRGSLVGRFRVFVFLLLLFSIFPVGVRIYGVPCNNFMLRDLRKSLVVSGKSLMNCGNAFNVMYCITHYLLFCHLVFRICTRPVTCYIDLLKKVDRSAGA